MDDEHVTWPYVIPRFITAPNSREHVRLTQDSTQNTYLGFCCEVFGTVALGSQRVVASGVSRTRFPA